MSRQMPTEKLRALIAGNPDMLLWGARNIAIGADLFDASGEPRERAAFHMLANGTLPGRKVGGVWCSTARQLRAVAAGEAA